MENSDFASLIETRVLLATYATSLAAQRRTLDDILIIQNTLDAYSNKVNSGYRAVEEYLTLHSNIAEASKNSVLKTMMMVITSDIVNRFSQLGVYNDRRLSQTLEEHKVILKHIIGQDAEMASKAMREHLKADLEYSKVLKK